VRFSWIAILTRVMLQNKESVVEDNGVAFRTDNGAGNPYMELEYWQWFMEKWEKISIAQKHVRKREP